MKKIIVFAILCATLLLLIPGVVSAEDESVSSSTVVTDPHTITQSGTTQVTYGVAAKYYLKVPANFVLSADSDVAPFVGVHDARLEMDTYVNVTVESDFYNTNAQENEPAWRLMHNGVLNDAGDWISYHLHKVTRNVDNKGTLDDSDDDITYVDAGKIASGTVILTAHAEKFDNGLGEVNQYMKFHIDSTSLSASTYAGKYWDILEFSAGIYNADGTEYTQN